MAEGARGSTVHLGRGCVRVAEIAELPISSHVGPELDFPNDAPQVSVDEQIADAIRRLEEARVRRRSDLEDEYHMPDVPKAIPWMRPFDALEAQRALSLREDPRYRLMREDKDRLERDRANQQQTEWRETFERNLHSVLDELQNMPDAVSIQRQLYVTYNWYRQQLLAQEHHIGFAQFSTGPRPTRWENAGVAGPHFFELTPEDLAADGALPGSAFFATPAPQVEEGTAAPGGSGNSPPASPSGKGGADDLPPQPPAAQLPSAAERLRDFERKQVASPIGYRRLKLAELKSSQFQDWADRPFTPTTAAGSYTSRSAYSARSTATPSSSYPHSARSTPSPFPSVPSSRPTSAASNYQRPLTAQSSRSSDQSGSSVRRRSASGLPQRPGTATGTSRPRPAIPEVPMTLRPTREEPRLGLSVRGTIHSSVGAWEPEAPTDAEIRMEERWLRFRQREITDQQIAEERRAVVREWAERRARVEEEIARNTETARYQSELQRRAYNMPEDADEDIEASAPSRSGASAPTPTARAPSPSKSATGGSGGAGRRARSAVARAAGQQDPPRFDVSKVDQASSSKVKFTWDGGRPVAPRKPAVASSRAAYLRTLHKRLLAAPEGADPFAASGGGGGAPGGLEAEEGGRMEEEGEGLQEEAPAACIFDTPAGEGHVSLSAYTLDRTDLAPEGGRAPMMRRPDDSDVLATVCKHWWKKQGVSPEELSAAGLDVGLEEMRFKQQQEVEEVKRVMARRNRPVDAAVLERALVMPVHRLTGAGAMLKPGTSALPSNPFFQKPTKKKKKKDVKGAKPKGGARTSSAGMGAGP